MKVNTVSQLTHIKQSRWFSRLSGDVDTLVSSNTCPCVPEALQEAQQAAKQSRNEGEQLRSES